MARRKNKRKILLGPLRAALIAPRDIDFLFLDNFEIEDAAPLADPLPADVIGSWDVLDTTDVLDVTGGVLEINGRVDANDPRVNARDADGNATWTRVAGLAAFFRYVNPTAADGHTRLGWDNAATGSIVYQAYRVQHGGLLQPTNNNSPVRVEPDPLADDVEYDLAIILRASGAHFYAKGGTEFPDWTHVFSEDALNASPVYLAIAPTTAAMTRGIDTHSARIVQLPVNLQPSPALSDNFGTIPTLADSGSQSIDITPVRVGLSGSEASFDGVNSYGALDVVSMLAAGFDQTECGYGYTAGGTGTTTSLASVSTTDWFTMGNVISKSGDEMQPYRDGAVQGAAKTGLGVWGTDPVNNESAIGAADIVTPANPGRVEISDFIITLNGVLPSATDMATIDTALDAGTLTAATLNSLFGAGNWVWNSLNEQYASDGLGHLEADGSGANKTQLGPTVSYAGNKAYFAPLGGDEVIVNGGFDADTDWTKGTDWTIAAGVATKAAGAAASNLTEVVASHVAGNWYRRSFTISNYSAGSFSMRIGGTTGKQYAANGTYTETHISPGTSFNIRANTGASAADIDDVTTQQLALADILGLYQGSSADVYLRDDLTAIDNYQAGIAARWDSQSSPASGIIVFLHQLVSAEKIVVGKYVSGTYTEVSSTAVTYSAGAKLEVHCFGSVVHVYYNGADVVTDTISDSEILNNTLHGIFGTENATTHEDLEGYNIGAIDYSPYMVGA
jgi:hypothetical protein